MIATSFPILLSIWALSLGLVVTAFHLRWTNKRALELERRVHELEMERDFPGWSKETR